MGQKHYSQAYKEEAIQFYLQGHSLLDTLERFGVAQSTLFEWKKRFESRESIPTINVKKERQRREHLEKLALELEVLRMCPGGPTASVKEKLRTIDSLSDKYSIHVLCDALQLPRGTYYNRKRREGKKTSYQINDEIMKPLIEEIFVKSKGRFGRKPIQCKLQERGYRISEKRVSRLMKEMGLEVVKPAYEAVHKKPLPRAVYRNLLSRKFDQPKPNLVWVSDITYIRVADTYYYICVVLDLFSRKVLAYRISDGINAELTLRTFDEAFITRGMPRGLLFHSDQGSQYTASLFREFLRERKVRQSFSKPGNPYDNSVCESFFHTLKKEALYHHLYDNTEQLKEVLEEYIYFYNVERPHRKLKMKTPEQFEAGFPLAATI